MYLGVFVSRISKKISIYFVQVFKKSMFSVAVTKLLNLSHSSASKFCFSCCKNTSLKPYIYCLL